QISRTIERIADHAVTIATNVQNLLLLAEEPDGKIVISAETIQMFRRADEMALTIFKRSMRSFYDRNIREANAGIVSLTDLNAMYTELKTMSIHQKNPASIYFGYIANSIARIGEYSSDISEIVINHCIGEE
ncbi:MAG: Phosphate uptake regulator, PhoU, partial [Methanocalculus sp. 52_23]